jgi:hypothetical protein
MAFVGNALRELRRKWERFNLRRAARRHDRARHRALVALGQCAWEEEVGLSAADQEALGHLETQAGSLAAELTSLQADKARLEKHRATEIAGRREERLAVETKKRPVDEALRAARAAPAPAPEPDPALVEENARLQAELDRIDAAQRAAVAELDGMLAGLRSQIHAKNTAATGVSQARDERFAEIGAALVARGAAEPALASAMGEVAAVDRARAETAASIDASLAETAGLPRRTMTKFAALIASVAIVLTSAVVGAPVLLKRLRDRAARAAVTDTADLELPNELPPFRPFSADERVTEGGRHHIVKVYATETALRSEGEEDGHAFILILRLDKKLLWSLSPEKHEYTEIAFDAGDRADALRDDSIKTGCKLTGKERIADLDTVRELCPVTIGEGRTYDETRWIAEELGGIVVKRKDPVQIVELTNIELGDQDSDLFELPHDYDLRK